MKNVFGMYLPKELDNDDRPVEMDGTPFITRRVSPALQARMDNLDDRDTELDKKASLPMALFVVKAVTGLAALILVTSFIKALANVTLAQACANVPWLIPAAVLCAVIWFMLWLTERRKKNSVQKSEDRQAADKQIAEAKRQARMELGVPEDSLSVDVLAFLYTEKKGKPVSRLPFDYMNMPFRLFVDERSMYLADDNVLLEFPREEVAGMEKVRRRVTMGGWNKEERYNAKQYRPYKMTTDNMGRIHIKWYYSLRINSRYGQFEILFPPYEGEQVAELLGITPVDAHK